MKTISMLLLVLASASPGAQEPTPTGDFVEFAREIEQAFDAGEEKVISERFDFDLLVEANTRGLNLGEPQFNGMEVGLKVGMGMGSPIRTALAQHSGTFEFLRLLPEVDGMPRAFYRLESGMGLDYYELYLRRNDSGEPRIVDYLIWSSGARKSAETALGYRAFVLWNNPDMVGELEPDDRAELEAFGAVQRALQEVGSEPEATAQDFLETLDTVRDTLTPELAKAQWLQIQYIGICMQLADEPLRAALDDLAETHPDCSALPIMGMGMSFMADDLVEARTWIDRLDLRAEDPYLDLVRARVARRLGEHELANKLLSAFEASGPKQRAPLVIERLMLAIEMDDHETTLAMLLENEREGYANFAGFENAPKFQSFVESSSYAAWLERKR